MIRRLTFIVLVTCLGSMASKGQFPFQDPGLKMDARLDDLISRLTMEEKIAFLMNNNPRIERLGIHEYDWWNEGMHGVSRNGVATVFPHSIGLAATFDTSLIRRVGETIADEARAKYNVAQKMGNYGNYAGLSFWSPNINLFRDPRWGRGQETYGEDPFLTGRIAVAFTRGMQGDYPGYIKVATCAKHFAAHSGPENNRTNMNAEPSKKDLFETYLPAFETLVSEGKVEMVMCAYSKLSGQPCCGNYFLLTELLRNRWHFKGHIVTDCSAVSGFHNSSKVTATPLESALLAINSGVDMSCGEEFTYLNEAVKKHLVSEDMINDRLRNILRSRFKLGLFDPPGKCPFDTIGPGHINCKSHRALAREAAASSIVLLKNKNNVLPLKKNARRYYLVGPNAATIESLLGSYYGTSDNMSTILEGVNAKISYGTSMEYKYAFTPDQEPVNPLVDWHCQQMNKANAIIVCAGLTGLMEGEEGETILTKDNGDRSSITLPQSQITFLKRLKKNGSAPIVLVINSGSPVALGEAEELADAIIYAWYPGEEGGNAIADVLFGDYNPSGRLPVTVPASTDQLPAFTDYSMRNRTYRYMKDDPAYPFGFGLSYTNFNYSDLYLDKKVLKQKDSLIVKVKISNTGSIDGNEIVQLYLGQQCDSLELPQYSLKGFKKIFLKAGESKEVSFVISNLMMSQINSAGERIFFPGKMKVWLGGACPSSKSQTMGIKFTESEFIKK